MQSQRFAACGRGGQRCGAGRSRVSHAPTATPAPTLLPLGPFPCRRVTPGPQLQHPGHAAGRDAWAGAARAGPLGVTQPARGWEHLSQGWAPTELVTATELHAAVGSGAQGEGLRCSQAWRRSCLGPHAGHPGLSPPPTPGTGTWGFRRQEEGTGPCRDTIILSLCKTVRLADAARAGGRDAPVPTGPTAWGQRTPGPAPCPGPRLRAGLRVRMLVAECIYTLSPTQSNKFQIKQK